MSEENKELGNIKIKSLPKDKDGQYKKTFVANGRKYTILGWEDGISMDRWQVYQQLSIEGGYDLTFQSLYDKIVGLEKMINEAFLKGFKAAEFIAELRAIKDGIASKAVQRVPKIMRLAAVFIVREGEDVRYYNETIAQEKIGDWQEEGLDIQDLFTIALNSIQGWAQVLNNLMGNG